MQNKFFYFRCKYFGSLEGKKLEKQTYYCLLTYMEWVSGFLFIYIFLPEKEQMGSMGTLLLILILAKSY